MPGSGSASTPSSPPLRTSSVRSTKTPIRSTSPARRWSSAGGASCCCSTAGSASGCSPAVTSTPARRRGRRPAGRRSRRPGSMRLPGRTVTPPALAHVDVHPGGRGHTHLDLRYAGRRWATPTRRRRPDESQDVHWFTGTRRPGVGRPPVWPASSPTLALPWSGRRPREGGTMDVSALHRRTVETFLAGWRRSAAMTGGTAATPCTEWDVRELVNHVVGEDRWTAAVARRGDDRRGRRLVRRRPPRRRPGGRRSGRRPRPPSPASPPICRRRARCTCPTATRTSASTSTSSPPTT